MERSAPRLGPLRPVSLLALAPLAALAACTPEVARPARPPEEVVVATPDVEDVPVYVHFTGVTAPAERVEIRARVPGFLQEVAYEPGAVVQEGQRMFKIDPVQFEAEVASQRARLQSAEADRELARVTLERMQSAGQGAVAEIQVEEAQAQVAVAEAAVAIAQAGLDDALLRLEWTDVVSPITGVASRNLADVGNLVGSGDATLLATVVAEDRMYAYFDVSERQYLMASRQAREAGGALEDPSQGTLEVELAIADDTGYRFAGILDYKDPEVDPSTGTLRLRGTFPNPDGDLVGGLFVRVRIRVRTLEDALLVSERAIARDQAGAKVLVVVGEDQVDFRGVELGERMGDRRVILGGLQPDDRVVVEGLVRAGPGVAVKPISR